MEHHLLSSSSSSLLRWSVLLLGILLVAGTDSLRDPCRGNATTACLNFKLSKTLDRINNVPEIPLTNWLSLVKDKPVRHADLTESERVKKSSLLETKKEEGFLTKLGDGLDRFLTGRRLRLTLPSWVKPSPEGGALDLDILGRGGDQDLEEGRRKGGKKGHGMGMMMAAMMGKMGMMTMGLIKMKALKALLIGTIALVLSKIQLFKMLSAKKGDGGGESHVIVIGGGHGGGGGGGHGGGGGGGHGGGGGGGHGGYGGGWSGAGTVHLIQESYGGGGDSWSGGGGGHGGGGGDSWSGGGGHGGGWTSGGGGGGGGWSSGGGWGKRAYASDISYKDIVSTTPSKTR